MFLQYYGFHEQPFGFTPNPRYLFPSESCREAHASLLCGIANSVGFSILVADPGMGKTTLLFSMLEQLRDTARTAFVFNTQGTPRELLRYINHEFELPDCGDDPVKFHEQFKEFLLSQAREEKTVVLLLDEAQNLDETSLETIRLLSDFETPGKKLLQIVLAGQPQFAEKLSEPSLSQLSQRIAAVSRLARLSEDETSAYIAHHVSKAGYCGSDLFTPDARSWIADRAQGIPREINRLCFNGLSIACALQKRVVDVAILAEVEHDLDLRRISEAGSVAREEVLASPATQCAHEHPSRPDPMGSSTGRGSATTFSPVSTAARQARNAAVFPQSATRAIEGRRGESSVSYEHSNRVPGAETKTNWQHPARNSSFVPEKSLSRMVSTALKVMIATVIVIEIAVAIVLREGGAPATLQIIDRVRDQLRTLVNGQDSSSTTSFGAEWYKTMLFTPTIDR